MTLTAVLCIGFALVHMQVVELTFSPMHDPIELPLAAVALGLFAAGFIIGGFMVWLNGHDTRRNLRLQNKKVKNQSKELEDWRSQSAETAIIVREEAA